VARRAAAIEEQRKIDPALLLFSAGDWSGAPGIIDMYRSRFLETVMTELGYTAIALGERDLTYGLRALRASAEAGLPVICANLYEGGRRVFPASIEKRVHGRKIGVFALLDEKPRDIEGVELRDPAVEGRAVAAELARRCDYVILLAHMDREKLVKLIPTLSGVDLVIRGHAVEGEKTNKGCVDTLGGVLEHIGIPVLYAGERARNIGSAVVSATRHGASSIIASTLIHLDKSVADDPQFAARVVEFQQEESLRQRELLITKTLARDEATGRVRERYLGMEICRRCHADIMPGFVLSKHFTAFDALKHKGEETNPQCLACHTTGYGRFSGYDPEAEKQGAPYLRGVQCEACHGPGTMHARDGSYVASARAACTTCHTSQWSPRFDYETYWKRVSHRAARDSATVGAPR
jgi:hypothetical protein